MFTSKHLDVMCQKEIWVIMKARSPNPIISSHAQDALNEYALFLRVDEALQPSTIRNYISDLTLFISWYEKYRREDACDIKVFRIDAVSHLILMDYKTYLDKSLRRKSSTINRHLVSIKKYFHWAASQQYISDDPSIEVDLVPQTDRTIRYISFSEEQALVQAVQKYGSLRDQTIIILMLHTGLKVSELCSLKRNQINIHADGGVVTVIDGNLKSRQVPLNLTARTILEDYLEHTFSGGQHLFLSQKTGGPLTRRGLGFIIAKYVKKAELANISPHDLRHCFGYRMAQNVPLHRLAEIMGHDSMDTTTIYYQQSTQFDLQDAVETIAWK